METSDSSTSSYTLEHINQVKSKMEFFASVLATRGTSHDSSKLIEPEYSGWLAMDQEPRYPYGSEKYYDKINRFEVCSTLKMWNIPELFTIAENFFCFSYSYLFFRYLQAKLVNYWTFHSRRSRTEIQLAKRAPEFLRHIPHLPCVHRFAESQNCLQATNGLQSL